MTRNVAKFFSEQNADPGDFSLKSLNRVKNLGMISQIYLQKLGEQHDAFDLPEGLTAEGLGIDLEAVKRGREFAEEQGL